MFSPFVFYFELLEDEDDFVVPFERYRRLSELDSEDRNRLIYECVMVFLDHILKNVLGVVSSVGTMHNMEIKNSDGTKRDAA
ncbi:hypothetical protein GHT06_016953 [Daphnia sinensis]|uniref:Uncharacterized protein n=1 Tax=Daphnia sinensis TaxID=1820382 RepID=A0AAD5PRI2_9CRUS|nr:hypothetical protein GHT06_016953 [Daphnia sinensis]